MGKNPIFMYIIGYPPDGDLGLFVFSIFAQVNITNPTSWLVKFDVLIKLLYSPTGESNTTEIGKMAASRFVEVTDK